jgi:uncharacterized membrane protein YkoI
MQTIKKFITLTALVLLSVISIESYAGAVNRDQAVKVALNYFPGKVMAVKPDRDEKGNRYKVKILNPQGHVRTIIIDASSGQIVNRR